MAALAGVRFDVAQHNALRDALDVNQVNFPKSMWQIMQEFLRTKDFPRSINYAVQLGNVAVQDLGMPVRAMGVFAGDVKNFMSAVEIPSKLSEMGRSITQSIIAPSMDNTRMVVKASADLVNCTCDTVKLVFIRLSKMNLYPVEMIGFVATIIGSSDGVIEDLQHLSLDGMNTQKGWIFLLNLGRDLSYVTAGCLGVSALAIGAVPSFTMLGFLTSGLVFGVGGFFTERIVDPAKNQDIAQREAALNARMRNARNLVNAGAAA